MTAILTWLGARRWLLELAGAGALVAGMLWYHHHVFSAGIAAQQGKDAAALARAQAAADAQTLKLQLAASAAEVGHAKEIAEIHTYLAAHVQQPVRLCVGAASGVPQAGAPVGGTAAAGAAAAGVQPLPYSDSDAGAGRPGPDVGGLLQRLGAAADALNARYREFQTRGVNP